MFDVNEILAMLQNGESTESIAQKALDAVNEAARIQKEKEEEAKRIEAEKAIQQKIEADKKRALDDALSEIIEATINYFELINPDVANALAYLTDNITDDEVDDLHKSISAMAEMTVALQKLDDILGNDIGLVSKLGINPKAVTAQVPAKTVSDDEILANFLTKIVG